MYTDVRLGIYQSQVADLFPGDCSGLDTIFEFMHHSLLVLSLSLSHYAQLAFSVWASHVIIALLPVSFCVLFMCYLLITTRLASCDRCPQLAVFGTQCLSQTAVSTACIVLFLF